MQQSILAVFYSLKLVDFLVIYVQHQLQSRAQQLLQLEQQQQPLQHRVNVLILKQTVVFGQTIAIFLLIKIHIRAGGHVTFVQ